MRCKRCGSEVNERWKFCPSCGSALERPAESDLFGDVFERMEQQMKEMNKAFESNFEVVDLSPFFAKPTRGRGFSIRITHSSDGKPKFDIKTFGDVNRKQVESEASKLGFRDRISRAFKPEKGPEAASRRVCFEGAKTTAEPETCVRNMGGRIIAEVKLPDVKDADHIEVKPLENSVEIKAIAGDRAYFKILTKPPQTSVVRQEFRKGVLIIELA